MKDSRYKEIMDGLGMPNSQSLLIALRQVANEVAQEVHSEYKKNNEKLQTNACDHIWIHGVYRYDKRCKVCDSFK